MDVGHGDVAAVHFLLGGFLDHLGHIAIGDGAEENVVVTGLLLDGEAANGVEGGAEGQGLLLEGGLALGLLGPAVFHLLHHGRRDGNGFAEGEQKVAGVARSHLNQITIPAEAENVLIQNDLYALGHGDAS